MGAPSLEQTNLVRLLSNLSALAEKTADFAGLPKPVTKATVVDVNDPQERGRVRVIFDAHNYKDIPEVTGAGRLSCPRDGKEKYVSHWIDTVPSFKGKQPSGLIDKRVSIVLPNSQYQYALLGDVLYDPQDLTDEAAGRLTTPNNSPMTRLPVYKAGELPKPYPENLGCIVIEEGGPMNSDWLCVCVKRDGKCLWVRHADLNHGHAGGNDIVGPPDAAGNRPSPAPCPTIGSNVYVTSHSQPETYSNFGNSCTGNPFGGAAYWNAPPGGETWSLAEGSFEKVIPKEQVESFLKSQEQVAEFLRAGGGFSASISGFTPPEPPKIPAAVESVKGYNFAQDLISKAIKAYNIYKNLNEAIKDPTQFVIGVAESVATSYTPEGTKDLIAGLENPNGLLSQVYETTKEAIGI